MWIKLFRKKSVGRRRIIVWVCFSSGIVLVTLLLAFLFVWSRPLQPCAAKETVASSPTSFTPEHTPIKTTQPDPTKKPMVMQESFTERYEQNSDIVGWITLPGTPIDYPVMQTDNDFYMDHDFNRTESKSGSPFLDTRCDFSNMYQAAHQIVYGHNMQNGTMFQALTRYEDESFFEDNRYIYISTLYGHYTFEVFSVYKTPISFNYLRTDFGDRKKWLTFIQELRDKSLYPRDIKLSEDDVVVTLSTCTNKHIDDLRFVVHARLENSEMYDVEYTYIY